MYLNSISLQIAISLQTALLAINVFLIFRMCAHTLEFFFRLWCVHVHLGCTFRMCVNGRCVLVFRVRVLFDKFFLSMCVFYIEYVFLALDFFVCLFCFVFVLFLWIVRILCELIPDLFLKCVCIIYCFCLYMCSRLFILFYFLSVKLFLLFVVVVLFCFVFICFCVIAFYFLFCFLFCFCVLSKCVGKLIPGFVFEVCVYDWPFFFFFFFVFVLSSFYLLSCFILFWSSCFCDGVFCCRCFILFCFDLFLRYCILLFVLCFIFIFVCVCVCVLS